MDHDFISPGEDAQQFLRQLHGRTMAAMSDIYPLPVDSDEIKRSEFHHRLLQLVFSGRNYIGPVKEALQFGQKRRILDLGTGAGRWAIEMADEFPRADVIGVDIAPIQPEFEICNVDDEYYLPYLEGSFDLIHARSIHVGIRDYSHLLEEIGRLLRPGGLVLLIEPDLFPTTDSGIASPRVSPTTPTPANAEADFGNDDLRPPDPSANHVTILRGTSFANRFQAADSDNSVAGTLKTPPRHIDPLPGISAAIEPEHIDGVNVMQGLPHFPNASSPHSLRGGSRVDPIAARTPNSQDLASSSLLPADPTSPSSSQAGRAVPNRRHLDFILNPVPPAAGVSGAHLPQPGQGDDSIRADESVFSEPHPPQGSGSAARSTDEANRCPMQGWTTLWSTYRDCLQHPRRGIDTTVPSRLGELLDATDLFENINVKQANVPVGFWPKDETSLTAGQLQWMDYELLVPALRIPFLINNIPEERVERIIKDAQHDLYYPTIPFFTHIHVAYASRRFR